MFSLLKSPRWHLKISHFVKPTVQNPKIFHLQWLTAKKKQQILIKEKLELENDGHSFLENDKQLFDYQNRFQFIFCQSTNRITHCSSGGHIMFYATKGEPSKILYIKTHIIYTHYGATAENGLDWAPCLNCLPKLFVVTFTGSENSKTKLAALSDGYPHNLLKLVLPPTASTALCENNW